MTELKDLVAEGAILLDIEACDDRSLIAVMADALVGAGVVGTGYGKRCIDREGTNPTGLETIGGNIAIPHAEPDEGDTPAIAIARLAAPISFGAMAEPGQSVDAAIVFMLALPGGEAHLDALGRVVELAQDPVRMSAIMEARDPAGVRAALGEEAT